MLSSNVAKKWRRNNEDNLIGVMAKTVINGNGESVMSAKMAAAKRASKHGVMQQHHHQHKARKKINGKRRKRHRKRRKK
jgi:hypothetical protein